MTPHLRPLEGHHPACQPGGPPGGWRALAAAALLVGGCTTVVVHSEGRITLERRFGILSLDFANARTSAVAVSSVGVVALPDALSIGWTTWQGVRLAPGAAETCFSINFAPPPPKE